MSLKPTRVIALVGLPGSGKSTVGRVLARRLDIAFLDTDDLIEVRLGEPIRSFFEREGENAFRDIESQVLSEVLRPREPDTPKVLATGGGIVLRSSNRQMLQLEATVVYLAASPEDLSNRLRRDQKRPLLQVADPLARLRELHLARDPLYREVADFVIESSRSGPRSCVGLVQMQLELAGIL